MSGSISYSLFAVPEPRIPDAINVYLKARHLDEARVEPLAGDASDRRYFRVIAPSGSSAVLALHARPFAPGSLPFVNVAELFSAVPIPVPQVQEQVPDLGLLVQEDLGDVTLQAHLAGPGIRDIVALYEQAVDYLLLLQRRGQELEDPRYLPYGLAFDVEKLMFEMNFFISHFLEAYRGTAITPAARQELTAELLEICTELAAEPRVLCHRDYHSRNLMVTPRGLAVIDMQDARMGPDTYDLVSLLRDSYVDLPEALFERLIERFRTGRANRETRAAFDTRFGLMAMQRNLKALGTFGYQAIAKANPAYAQYVPRTLRYVRAGLARHRRFDRLAAVLGSLVPDVRVA